MKTLMLVAILAVSGCALTPEQRVVHMIKTYSPACQKLGFEVDSDANRQCMLQMDARQQADDAAIAGIIMQGNAGIQAAFAQNQPPPYQPPRSMTCIPAGNGIRCY